MAGYTSLEECIVAHFSPKKYQLHLRVQVQDLNRSAEVANFECFLCLQRILKVTKHLELNALLHSS